MKDEQLINLVDIHRRYPMGSVLVHALRGVNLIVNEGDFLVVTGPSGSGKSSLMNILGLLDRPDDGNYYYKGQKVSNLDDDQRSYVRNSTIGFVFQNFNLLPRATALRNVMLPLLYRSIPDVQRNELAKEALGKVGLSERMNHVPTQLSGGEQQRVAMARALVGGPSLILADEPTGNLDTKTGQGIVELLFQLSQQGQTVIMVTHDPRLLGFADRIVSMLDGVINEETNNGGK
ncbi:MAG: ABC transporter ATP-binding protein [Candidatus Hatepunaea meridiana]|nr:ABC transporter ATP-binding protein [Candidatus Hatepunaea meridiana]